MKSEAFAINGILLLDKPYGKSSNHALQQVKRLYKAKKAGHTGSLDPMATGMLPICFGEATKFSQFLLDADKCYETTGILGIKTNTGDALGQVTSKIDNVNVSQEKLNRVIEEFKGWQEQTPPMYSALKHQGVPLYKYARQGIELERKPRAIHIQELEVTRFENIEVDLHVRCSKGTYIRNLVEDIGERLEFGAHISRLHRKYTAGFEDKCMYSMEELQCMTEEELHKILLPVDVAIQHLPPLFLPLEPIVQMRQGKIISVVDTEPPGLYRLYNDLSKDFIGIGEIEDGNLRVKRLLAYS